MSVRILAFFNLRGVLFLEIQTEVRLDLRFHVRLDFALFYYSMACTITKDVEKCLSLASIFGISFSTVIILLGKKFGIDDFDFGLA